VLAFSDSVVFELGLLGWGYGLGSLGICSFG